MVNNDLLLFACQACINSYKGIWGEVKPLFDKEEDFGGGFFAYKNDTLHIIFQGSLEFSDWVDNFRFSKENHIHTGFLQQFGLYREKVFDKLGKHKKVFTTGHSMGGALAVICNAEIRNKFADVKMESVTFGCPRVGDEVFKFFYEVETHRVVNANDLVPKFPTKFMNYKHVGNLINIGTKKWYKPFSVQDHDPRSYLKSLTSR